MALVGLLGDGRLLPVPDFPAKVINLGSGYARENRNWVIGRILRDDETALSTNNSSKDKAIHIVVYTALPDNHHSLIADNGKVGRLGFVIIVVQFVIAAFPLIRHNDWGVILITLSGTFLVQIVSALPQWSAEKLPWKRGVTENIAITSGNGSRHVMIIMGSGNAIDLEQLASPISPRSSRVWENIRLFSLTEQDTSGLQPTLKEFLKRLPSRKYGIPMGHWVTLVTLCGQTIAWLALLISVAGIKTHTWHLLLVGLLGMFQNAFIAGISRDPRKRHLPLKEIDHIATTRVMDGLMDLDVTFTGFGRSLINEFFPGKLERKEKQWWEGNRFEYDEDRKKDDENGRSRETPRSEMPQYANPRGLTPEKSICEEGEAIADSPLSSNMRSADAAQPQNSNTALDSHTLEDRMPPSHGEIVTCKDKVDQVALEEKQLGIDK